MTPEDLPAEFLPEQDRSPQFSPLTWCRLMRLPTVFTAWSNILCGYLLTRTVTAQEALRDTHLLLLLCSSAGLYLGGMVLNDFCDASLDAAERPERPIPSGQIARWKAGMLAGAMMLFGVACAFAVGTASLQIALILVVAVTAYDYWLKHTSAGPLAMGACRFFNLMLGASGVAASEPAALWQFPQTAVAGALFTYIVGVTWFARHEALVSSARPLWTGLLVVMCGLLIDGWVIRSAAAGDPPRFAALVCLSLLAANLLLRAAAAIRSRQPRQIQKTVGLMLLSLIFLDSIVIFAKTGDAALASLVVILVVPATLLKRVIPMS